eukprot:9226981-Ditylum_brightwellii.AAC.1
MTQFDLHVHSCKHNYRRDTQAIAFVSDQAESRSVKSKLYRLNNSMEAERKNGHTLGIGSLSRSSLRGA